MIQVEQTSIAGLCILIPRIFEDERGHFLETYSKKNLADAGISDEFVQDNESVSRKHVLRGLHFQAPPHAQGKLVRVARGAALDVAVDIRKNSPTYGQYVSVMLDAVAKKMFWIPAGFAHGFVALEDHTVFQYKCTGYYHKEAEGALRWDDPLLSINWGVDAPIVSAKDQQAGSFAEFKSPF
jgi:dTDP-4-dehydrorhamnose 3,5-epimerase